MELNNRLKKMNIKVDSELGKKLIVLDKLYQHVEDINNKIEYLKDKKNQYIEDIEMFELGLMYNFNKEERIKKWD